jgi:hypothetical protein
MRTISRIVAWLLLLGATPTPLYAQAARAELTGRVTTADGSALPGAHITVRALRTNDTRVVISGDNGFYTLPALPPGGYAVTVELAGFKRFAQNTVTLAIGERVRLDVLLAVGGLQETVTVTGEPSTMRTESGSLGQVVPNAAIVGLPLNGRGFISLITLAPGVASPPGSAFPRINGGRPRVNEYLFDGVSVLQPEPGQVAFTPVVDAIDEFKVETNSPSAEFGRFNGGVINLTTKSGTNTLNGAAFAFTRHESLNARNAFAPAGGDKPVFRRQQFGGVIGGPVARDRTFFFADYQGTRQEIGRVRISTVPTLLQRQGIFTEVRRANRSPSHDFRSRLRPHFLRARSFNPRHAASGRQRQHHVRRHRPHEHQRVRARVQLHAIFSDRLLNELRIGYTRRGVDRAALSGTLPTYVIDGFQQLGPPANTFTDFRTDVTHLVDVLTWQRGAHTIKGGTCSSEASSGRRRSEVVEAAGSISLAGWRAHCSRIGTSPRS